MGTIHVNFDWRKRVENEKNELDMKIAKLETFLKDAPNNLEISLHQLYLLSEQLVCMKRYSFILNERLRSENK